MADLKISQLTAISVLTPATDVLPVVDVGGVTKKITTNQILGSGGTATLASATITGDLTAARLIVTGGTIPTNGLWLATTNTLEFAANSLAQYRIAPLGVFSWYDGAGGTRMTLNSTGLGVGVSPAQKLDVDGNIRMSGVSGGTRYLLLNADNTYTGSLTIQSGGGSASFGAATILYGNSHATYPGGVWIGRSSGSTGPIMFGTGGSTPSTIQMTLDSSGNLLVGKTSGVNKIETVGAGVDGRGTVTGVSTVATTIYTIKQSATAAMCVVFGDDGTNGFCDIVLFLATVAPKVVSSQTLYGSPAARTYSASTTNLQLALASGTLSIRTAALSTLNT